MMPIRVLNVMESLGVGGGQIMMFELSNGLNKYSNGECVSIVAGIKQRARDVVVQPQLMETYGVPQLTLNYSDLSDFCQKEKIDVVLHHRISISNPIKKYLPKNVKYIVISHTAASIGRIRDYYPCADYIVSVCKNLHACSPMVPGGFDYNKMVVILNGIENDFVAKLEPIKLAGTFKTGRCHRLVPTKFALDSLAFFENNKPELPGHIHYLMGSGNKGLPGGAKNKTTINYLGEITDRDQKFRYIKSLDVYFYEIFSNEGASIAVLEALACGVPVVCIKKGGIRELVLDQKTGFIVKTREDMLKKLKILQKDRNLLKKMKENVVEDFDSRLHIRHCAKKYVNLMKEALN